MLKSLHCLIVTYRIWSEILKLTELYMSGSIVSVTTIDCEKKKKKSGCHLARLEIEATTKVAPPSDWLQ